MSCLDSISMFICVRIINNILEVEPNIILKNKFELILKLQKLLNY